MGHVARAAAPPAGRIGLLSEGQIWVKTWKSVPVLRARPVRDPNGHEASVTDAHRRRRSRTRFTLLHEARLRSTCELLTIFTDGARFAAFLH
jgi:hypothetical protein